MLRTILVAMVVIGLAGSLSPSASANPAGQLDGLTDVVNDPRYNTYREYGRSFSPQFVTSDGVRCRIYGTHRGSWPLHADCWGELPGTDANHAIASGGELDQAPFAVLDSIDISEFEKSYVIKPEGDGYEDITFDTSDYAILLPGNKITTDGSSCGVTAHEIICIHETGRFPGSPAATVGFVLSPSGSYTF